ncbi:probable craniofacial development protein 1 at C-terminar half [Coccomyxa sp. Obi]|nr:probable craniofacial development protein 1 at C-terminar half [Coccomyxa sp. Obi]
MSNIINAPDLPSEDEEDDDYDPSRDPDAGKDDKPGKQKKLPGGRLKRDRGSADEEGEDEDDDGDAEEQDVLPVHSKAATKKAKVNALWDQLQQGFSAGRPAASAGASTSGVQPVVPTKAKLDWGALCRPAPKAAPQEDRNRNWMLQLGFKGKIQSSAATAPPSGSQQPEPSRTADTASQQVQPPTSESQNNGQGVDSKEAVPEQKPAVSLAAAALAAAKAATSSTAAFSHGKVAVTETRRFAGKDIEMTKTVSVAAAEAEKQKRNKAGLDAVLASLQAAKKVNILDKSRSDWSTFKTSNTKVEEELEAYKKSGDKYLDKVDFLKRAELRQYEKERDARLAGDIRSRGRL